MKQLEARLHEYELSDRPDVWTLKTIQWQTDYKKCDRQLIKVHHSRIVAAQEANDKMGLLIRAERGRLYSELREEKKDDWMKFCEAELGCCSRTVKRYIDFYKLMNLYPRLLVCGFAMEAIMANAIRLVKRLQDTAGLALNGRLSLPLKKTSYGKTEVSEFRVLAKTADDEEGLETLRYKWTPCWQLRDKLEPAESADDEDSAMSTG